MTSPPKDYAREAAEEAEELYSKLAALARVVYLDCEPRPLLLEDKSKAAIQSAITAACAEKDERINILEACLTEAAEKLQSVVLIGQVKAIGLREVPAAIEMLISEKDAERDAMQRRAEAAESDWQAAIAERDQIQQFLNDKGYIDQLHKEMHGITEPEMEGPQ